ncbi:MAG: hypothetical protein ACOYXU_08575 [Nitrospirota bacterium]
MADSPPSSAKGYRYHLSDEAILRYMAWPIEVCLMWLEEANRFLTAVLPDEEKAIREHFKTIGVRHVKTIGVRHEY